jgi:hypothetical protein
MNRYAGRQASQVVEAGRKHKQQNLAIELAIGQKR